MQLFLPSYYLHDFPWHRDRFLISSVENCAVMYRSSLIIAAISDSCVCLSSCFCKDKTWRRRFLLALSVPFFPLFLLSFWPLFAKWAFWEDVMTHVSSGVFCQAQSLFLASGEIFENLSHLCHLKSILVSFPRQYFVASVLDISKPWVYLQEV